VPADRERVRRAPGQFPRSARAPDQDEYVYIDWCHLSPDGNQIIARRIGAAVAARTPVGTADAQG
jgi:hypothetical protein